MSDETKPSTERLATDATHPSVSVIRTIPSYEDAKLSTTHSNFYEWAWGIRNNLEEAGLWNYVTGDSLAPDAKSEPRAYSNWLSNNTTTKAFLIKNIDPHDARHHALRDCATAKDLWAKIKANFGKYSPAEQVNLIDKCLNTFLINDGTAISQIDKLIEDGKRAHEALTQNTWLCLLIMKAMSRDPAYAHHRSMAEHAISEAEIQGNRDTFTASSLRNMVILIHNNAVASGTTTSPTALAAQHNPTSSSTKKGDIPPPPDTPQNALEDVALDYDEQDIYNKPSPPPIPAPIIEPRRSERIPTRSNVPSKADKLQQAIQHSREVDLQAKALRRERKLAREAAKAAQDSTNDTSNTPNPSTPQQDLVKELKTLLTTLKIPLDTLDDPDSNIWTFIAQSIQNIEDTDANGEEDDPKSWKEADASPDGPKWRAAGKEEKQSMFDMEVFTWEKEEDVPPGAKILGCKSVFKKKRNENGEVVRHKVRFVVKGFEQIFGRDYHNTTSPTARMESWRILFHIAATLDWEINQMDVKTAFLYGVLPDDEVQYMRQPPGFEEPGYEGYVWKLQRGLYGMKQAGRIWNKTFDDAMQKDWGFTPLVTDPCVYWRKRPSGIVITGVHVDDSGTIASTKAALDEFKREMGSKWKITDLGEPKHIVGIGVQRDRANRKIFLSQTALIDRLVSQFGQSDALPVAIPMDPGLKLSIPEKGSVDRTIVGKLPYRSLIGAMLYIAIGTRPDISFAIQNLSQFLDTYDQSHWNAAIRVLRYLKGTRTLRLALGGDNGISLLGYTDSDWSQCPINRKSVSGYGFTLGGGLISWCARKQKTVSTSSCEAEYIAAFEATKEALWLRNLLSELEFIDPDLPARIECDNTAAIQLSEDPSLHSRVKHIDIKYHFIRDRVQKKQVFLHHIGTKDNTADIFTKALDKFTFLKLRGYTGLVQPEEET
ncbi:hypothetical protein CVT24_001911 [Panaeolus cyanescens]|uniref:Reverse transcriptase Ty1/copia-type domain-containing protein n=1 Tax=Panaeolus cyanescens TaxID=181874 RepID=A0A409WUY1_9AGAR|nr:hypothetical protein CVT24_001911 [Panaeolus cyanescens]